MWGIDIIGHRRAYLEVDSANWVALCSYWEHPLPSQTCSESSLRQLCPHSYTKLGIWVIKLPHTVDTKVLDEVPGVDAKVEASIDM